jgi:hypothetical protein
MSPAAALAAAVTFVWLGMVLAISFLEAPLKFRAPGVTLPIGLGIGRLVFKALNLCEVAFAVAVVLVVLVDPRSTRTTIALIVAVTILAAQLIVVRPRLARRSDAVLAGRDEARSHAHHGYVALELGKVLALLVAGIGLLAT